MLDGTISQTGRIWHQVQLAVLANGHKHSIPFLVCPIGNTPAILGMTWLMAEAPLIDWQQGLITFPEQAQIASEEEADPDPLADLPPQYHEFAKVFGEEEFKVLPPHREYDISIDLIPDAKLSPGPIYGMTDAESKALKQHIDEELATGKIRPSTSSAGAPVMFVKKADGSLRLVVDYRKLNDVTHKNVYPLPRQDDLMAKLRHAKMFTKLDLCWGYNNVRIKEGDEWKTAFRTKYGLFEYLVMPFGLTNAPAAFQHFMNDLRPKKHPEHVREVLSRLMKNQLFCKLSKCHFHVTTVDYLGIVISPAGFSMDQKKIEAVTSWPQPKTVKQVQAFLGFVNYLCRFIPNFSSVARPLHNLTKKEIPWSWETQEEEAFQELKSLVTRKQSGKPDALSRRADYVESTQEPEVMLPAEVFANTSEEELEIVTEIRSKLREDPSLEPIIQFLTEDADNAPPSICKAYRDYDWEEDLLCGTPRAATNLGIAQQELLWPGMKSSAKEWVECCPVCQANRRAHAPVIALKPLEVPPFPFHTILYDFITGFPKSQGHDAILVVIDSFSKFGHFIPTSKKVTAKGLADLFITHVWKLHGLPVKTVSDRGTTFTGKFLRALYQRLGVKPAFSSAYHPESDGQTERVNQFIEFYLRSYVAADHSDWATWLPLAEYAYNNAKHTATGKTPFELVYGRNPVMNPSNVPANVPEANQVADTLAQEWKEAESSLRMTKERMAGTRGVIPKYSVGEKVWLDGKNVELRTNSNKLDPKRLGPFEVTEKISSHAYRLKLPETLKIHDVFYVGLLSKTHESPSQPFPDQPPPETIEGEEEYKVEQIIDSKQQQGKWFYLIKWKGYGPEDNSWEPEELLEHSQEEIKRFNQARLRKARDAAKSL
ncbi:hypothetical protein RHS01_10345 [Rhizoctonia solani]|uniref:Uncharacterized protein n=1 Tax=Rhizoctonia solani TaxID=456999 RepID=A0A8H7I3L0_9AGAM|nr:hypothetical protein RHS01_10345 [Rhizoctonia solani]